LFEAILIADSGSTKTDWALINGNNKFHYKTIGYNPYFINAENIYNSISLELAAKFDAALIKKIFFYGAGCSNPANIAVINKALAKCFINSELFIGHDMLAAARALLGDQRGFAAIIGTGSNTCIYDGNKIEKNIDSLGYFLGDEGSGANIGKKIVRDFLRGHLPKELETKFIGTYHIGYSEIFDALYNKPLPNRFLAGFCRFADNNKDDDYVKKIVRESFSEFFGNLVSKYYEYEKYKFNCIGSVGFIFKDILKVVADSYNMQTGKIIHDPIDDLVEYHLKHL